MTQVPVSIVIKAETMCCMNNKMMEIEKLMGNNVSLLSQNSLA